MSMTEFRYIESGSSGAEAVSAMPESIEEKSFTNDTFSNEESEPETQSKALTHIRKTFKPSVRGRLPGHYELLQLWEGYVLSVSDNEFQARIIDKTIPENPEEEVVLPIKEVTEEDIKLLEEGAVFYWSIRYVDRPGEGRSRDSLIRLRRLPSITRKEIEIAKSEAKNLAALFSTD